MLELHLCLGEKLRIMPVDSLMPKKKSGSTSYIVASVLMLAAMGGLIVWKVGSRPKQDGLTEAPPPTSPPRAELEEPPPPPPPPPKVDVDADAKDAAVQTPGSTGGGNWGCTAATCTGTASAQLRSALRGKAGQARGCYERALRNNSMLQGRLVVNVRVGAQGQVCSAGIASNTLGDSAVSACVLQMFRAGRFPAAQGGCVDTAVPMNFVPKS